MSKIEYRGPSKLPRSGPYLGEITNHLDPSYMGYVEVTIIKGVFPVSSIKSTTYPVRYLSPFYGVTNIKFEGNNSSDFNDVQKSYGMWMLPPDIGTKVLVTFIDGDPNQGYILGFVPDDFQNHMVPGIAASEYTAMTAEQRTKYGTTYLPVAEVHKGSQNLSKGVNIERIPKAVHPFADVLLQQGLLLDTVRGVTSSSARREIPSSVFGISTPGPLDVNGKMGEIGYEVKRRVPVSRKGGSTFVMDDGDVDGNNELVRLRTRTGHQILLHNTKDLIYIANAKGTAWIELTSDGKIDVYAADSVSIHTEADFNFRADRDINLEAGRNFNLSVARTVNINSESDFNLIAENGLIRFNGSGNLTATGDLKIRVGADYNLVASGAKHTVSGTFNLTSKTNNFTSSGDTNIFSSGNHYETAGQIHMNGPAAATAAPAVTAESPSSLPIYSLPNIQVDAGWENGQFYNAGQLTSIMQRVPTHEPWPHHENINPAQFSSFATDSYAGTTSEGSQYSANQQWPAANNKQPASWAQDKEFIEKVKQVADKLGANYIDLLAVMLAESGMDPSIPNKQGSGGTGLIQFMPSVAEKTLKTTTKYLASLTRTQQMDWVLKYFQSTPLTKVKKPTIGDLYTAVLAPFSGAVGAPDSTPLYKAGSKAYSANATLDKNKDGVISKGDASTWVAARIPAVLQELANAGYNTSGA